MHQSRDTSEMVAPLIAGMAWRRLLMRGGIAFGHGRESTPSEKIKEAHRRVMVANHPDAGGSHYLASKINEAKDMMLRKNKGGSGSAF
ncbi:hypothetical protein V6N12_067171 [Hibiscus sabdariffa]|uniref:J domain-containing protein n=1 Tax=Hibiscus sabdariffa TaxID=183260 RepID=A0ABR2BUH4_9ROSI